MFTPACSIKTDFIVLLVGLGCGTPVILAINETEIIVDNVTMDITYVGDFNISGVGLSTGGGSMALVYLVFSNPMDVADIDVTSDVREHKKHTTAVQPLLLFVCECAPPFLPCFSSAWSHSVRH